MKQNNEIKEPFGKNIELTDLIFDLTDHREVVKFLLRHVDEAMKSFKKIRKELLKIQWELEQINKLKEV
jgi:predicted transcriptional regulator